MTLAKVIILFIIGIICIVKGGDLFVDSASWIAEVSGIPKLIVGATIVSVATTLPELIVSLIAAAKDNVDMSVGNAIGSVTANIGFIMAISLLFLPTVIKRKDYFVKSLLMILAAVAIVCCGIVRSVNLPISIVLLVIFAVFIVENVSGASKAVKLEAQEKSEKNKRERPETKEIIINVVKFILGAAMIVVGSDLLVDNGSELARAMGVSERIIGVTFIAIGTSLPELVTTITAIAKKQSSLSVGNILGANIIDLTLILPLCSLVSGRALPISETSAMLDLPACLVVGLITIVPAMIFSKFRRWQGVALLSVYSAYLYVTCFLVA